MGDVAWDKIKTGAFHYNAEGRQVREPFASWSPSGMALPTRRSRAYSSMSGIGASGVEPTSLEEEAPELPRASMTGIVEPKS